MALNSSPRTWTTGEVVTAAMLNGEIRDAITGLQSAWTAYTPTLTGITLGNGSLSAAYYRQGKTIWGRVLFVAGTTTTFTASATLKFSLPVAAHSAYPTGAAIGVGFLLDGSAGSGSRTTTAVNIDSGTDMFMVDAKDSSATVTQLAPWTWASTDVIYFSFGPYEAA